MHATDATCAACTTIQPSKHDQTIFNNNMHELIRHASQITSMQPQITIKITFLTLQHEEHALINHNMLPATQNSTCMQPKLTCMQHN